VLRACSSDDRACASRQSPHVRIETSWRRILHRNVARPRIGPCRDHFVAAHHVVSLWQIDSSCRLTRYQLDFRSRRLKTALTGRCCPCSSDSPGYLTGNRFGRLGGPNSLLEISYLWRRLSSRSPRRENHPRRYRVRAAVPRVGTPRSGKAPSMNPYDPSCTSVPIGQRCPEYRKFRSPPVARAHYFPAKTGRRRNASTVGSCRQRPARNRDSLLRSGIRTA